jgi:CPA2 family monovalent cation:H+ antiporter-2
VNTWEVVLDIALVLSVALLLGGLFERLRQNAVTGYLLAGLLLGPAGTGWISNVEHIRLLAELGVALLLFTIGLEFSLSRLRGSGRMAILGGTIQIVLTGAVGGSTAAAIGLSTSEAIVIGAALSLSSTAIVLRVLADRTEIESLHGRNALGILLLQDLAVVPLVLLVVALGEGVTGLTAFARFAFSIGVAAALIAAIFLVTKYVFPRLVDIASAYRNRDLPVVLSFAVCLGAAGVSHAANLSPILGAFLAGMLLAESPFAAQIRADITPLRAVFLTLFFTSVGMLAQLPTGRMLLVVVPLALAIMCGKAMIVGFVVRLFRQPHSIAVSTGLALSQVGEFSFVLLELGYRQGLLPHETFQALLSISIVTLVLTPYVIAGAPRLGEAVTRSFHRFLGVPPATVHSAGDSQHPSGHVIIVGFGPAGQRVAKVLRGAAIPFVVADLNPRAVSAHRSSVPIEFGDAARPEILHHLGLEHSRALVVTVPEPHTSELIIRQAKRIAPSIPVVARVRYHTHGSTLARAGADRAVDEENLLGWELVKAVQELIGGSLEAVDEDVRNEVHRRS